MCRDYQELRLFKLHLTTFKMTNFFGGGQIGDFISHEKLKLVQIP